MDCPGSGCALIAGMVPAIIEDLVAHISQHTWRKKGLRPMKSKARAMVMGSFAGDALALGVHWIYDTWAIETNFGRVERFVKPRQESYHAARELGDFTHYGDQALVLLESLADSRGFSQDDFAEKWKGLLGQYRGYLDKATKTTLENFALGKNPRESGSSSTELGGASRIAPLVFFFENDPEALVKSVRAQTAMTHHTPQVMDIAEFFARVAHGVLEGKGPVEVMKHVAEEFFGSSPLAELVDEGLDLAAQKSRNAILDLGQHCASDAAFPSSVQLIARYEKNLREGLIENVMAGGDSAARGLVVGMILGAHLGMESIPGEWMSEMREVEKINGLLNALESFRS